MVNRACCNTPVSSAMWTRWSSLRGDKSPPIFRKHFIRVPIGCGNNRLACPKGIRQGARNALLGVEIRRDVDICSTDELVKLLEIHKAIVKNVAAFHTLLTGQSLEGQAIGFALV